MKESLLHYVWRTKAFEVSNLRTTCGKAITLIDTGEWNHNSGPDFLHARLRLDDTLWAGHVEIHVKASHWIEHGHQHDPAYRSVVLHVVFENDTTIKHPNGSRIPCLELKKRIAPSTLNQYWQIMNNSARIPCEAQFPISDDLLIRNTVDRMLVERLAARTRDLQTLLQQQKQDWESAFYQRLGHCYGLPVNRDPFEALVTSLPLRTLLKYDRLISMEALFFGQARLLSRKYKDDYPRKLRKEYDYLQKKHHLSPIPYSWKFSRLRPAGFPTIRIAQFAALLNRERQLLSKCITAENVNTLRDLFRIPASPYWNSHFRFDRYSKRSSTKRPGKAFIDVVLINGIIPFVFMWGRAMNKKAIEEKALNWLEELPPEQNRITRLWTDIGLQAGSAYDTQALIQLYKAYCLKKKCLDCPVGSSILRPGTKKE